MENEITYTEPIPDFKAYNFLWQFFFDEHKLTLLHSEMDDIIHAVEQFKIIFNENYS